MSNGLKPSILMLSGIGVEAAGYRLSSRHGLAAWLIPLLLTVFMVAIGAAIFASFRRRPPRFVSLWVLGIHLGYLATTALAGHRFRPSGAGLPVAASWIPTGLLASAAAAAAALVALTIITKRLPPASRYGSLHASHCGHGPPVVLLHGLGASGRYWDAVIEEIPDRHTIAIDLLGFGRSPKPSDARYGTDCHVDAVAPLVPEGSYIVAHSAGAIVAIRLAIRFPQLVSGLLLLGLPIYPDERTAREQIRSLGPMATLIIDHTATAEILCATMCALRPLAAVTAATLVRDVPRAVAIDGVLHTWASYSRTLQRVVIEHDVTKDLDVVRTPMTFVAGTDDHIAPVSLQRMAIAHVGGATELHEIAGEDHHIALHQPRLVAAIIQNRL